MITKRVNLIITHKCNLNCKHCYMELTNRKHLSDEKIYEKIITFIDKLFVFGFKEIMFTGGEVFTFKYLLKVLKYSKSKGMKNIIFTNCLKFEFETLKYLDQVNISLDGPEMKHNYLRDNPNSYKSVLSVLSTLKEKDVYTNVQVSIGDFNINDIDNLLPIFKDHLNIRKVNLNIIREEGNAVNNFSIDENKLMKKILEKLPIFYKKTYYHIQFAPDLISRENFINNYINETPMIPLWVDIVDNNFYLVYNNANYDFPLEKFEKNIINNMYKNIHNYFKANKEDIIKNEYIDIANILGNI